MPNREAQKRRVERLARSEPLNTSRETVLSSSAAQNLLELGRARLAARETTRRPGEGATHRPTDPAGQRVDGAPTRTRGETTIPFIAGWLRVVDADPCYRCAQWNDGKLRPLETRMKAHPNCTCTIRLVLGKDAKNYDRTRSREPVARRPV